MGIRVCCPQCGKSSFVPDSVAGMVLKCFVCTTKMLIPGTPRQAGIKLCVDCGLDVSRSRRTRDQHRNYYCGPCWDRRLDANTAWYLLTSAPVAGSGVQAPAVTALGPRHELSDTRSASVRQPIDDAEESRFGWNESVTSMASAPGPALNLSLDDEPLAPEELVELHSCPVCGLEVAAASMMQDESSRWICADCHRERATLGLGDFQKAAPPPAVSSLLQVPVVRPEAAPPPPVYQPVYLPASEFNADRSAGVMGMLVGGSICLCGLLATFVSYSLAEAKHAEGWYLLCGGMISVGAIYFIRSFGQILRD